MKFCVLEYRPWRCMAEVCPPSSFLLLSFPANETVNSDSSFILIKTLHHHPPKNIPKKHHHRFYKFFSNNYPNFWGQIMTLPGMFKTTYYSWFSLLQMEDAIPCKRQNWMAFWLCHEGSFLQAGCEELELVIWKMRCFQSSIFIHWQNFFLILRVKGDEKLELNEALTREEKWESKIRLTWLIASLDEAFGFYLFLPQYKKALCSGG